MQIGEKVSRFPETFGGNADRKRLKKSFCGRVIYIHPAGRYHMVEFELKGGKARECFFGCDHGVSV